MIDSAQGTTTSFSIGICATGRSPNLGRLVRVISQEIFPDRFALNKILVVASECDKASVKQTNEAGKADKRVEIIQEAKRAGKADAINKIIDRSADEFLVLVNADAQPGAGSISMLLDTLDRNRRIGMVSGCPVFKTEGGTTSDVLQLIWSFHNECSLRLNHMGMSNHSSDELMVIRRNALTKLPDGLVNDGAYIAGRAKLRGFMINFSDKAKVTIDLPPRITDLIQQRRRILFGHFQIWKLTGNAPRTIESLLLLKPVLGVGVAAGVLARFPKLIRALPVALVGESISAFLALLDNSRSTKKHGVWKRYGN